MSSSYRLNHLPKTHWRGHSRVPINLKTKSDIHTILETTKVDKNLNSSRPRSSHSLRYKLIRYNSRIGRKFSPWTSLRSKWSLCSMQKTHCSPSIILSLRESRTLKWSTRLHPISCRKMVGRVQNPTPWLLQIALIYSSSLKVSAWPSTYNRSITPVLPLLETIMVMP